MSSNAGRLAEAVRKRRAELEMSQLEVQAAGGPSNTWQTLIEGGRLETLTRITARRIDAGLQWEEGSARDVWEGGYPRALSQRRLTEAQLAEINDLSPELRALVLEALEQKRPSSAPQREAGEVG